MTAERTIGTGAVYRKEGRVKMKPLIINSVLFFSQCVSCRAIARNSRIRAEQKIIKAR